MSEKVEEIIRKFPQKKSATIHCFISLGMCTVIYREAMVEIGEILKLSPLTSGG